MIVKRPALPVLAVAMSLAAPAIVAAEAPAALPDMQVTATKAPTPLLETPASVTVISGDELRARGAYDLRTALIGVAGVDIAPGGDSGPAGSVPGMWGLKEFDAFLLVVDNVPWGGAFNPALTSVDLHNVERIEVMRGAAPVMYGATSFVGVIHVIHYPAGQADQRAVISAGGVTGNVGNTAVSAAAVLPKLGDWQQSIAGSAERQQFADEQAGLDRGHVAYRLGGAMAGGVTHVDIDLNVLRQDPKSPYPKSGNGLDPSIDTDANFNPADAKMDENRYHLALSHVRDSGLGQWSTTASVTRTTNDIVRGFLADACGDAPIVAPDNACGYRQDRTLTDVYFDSHIVTHLADSLRLAWGVDYLYGKGEQAAEVFSYTVDATHGGDAPKSSAQPVLDEPESADERNFYGAYGQLEWTPLAGLDLFAGLRFNDTHERMHGDLTPGVPGSVNRNTTRLSGAAGISWLAWSQDQNSVTLFADYRDTFKPAAVDFGPEADAEILEPETARSYEAGAKTRWLGGRLDIDVSGFYMNMRNLVVPQTVGGTPGLENAGTLFFRGGELETRYAVTDDLSLYGTYAVHVLRFGDYMRSFDGGPLVQLRGNFQELTPRNTGSIGAIYAPAFGWQASMNGLYTGPRYLNKRNTSFAGGYTVWDAGLGYRFQGWGLGLHGYNLTDRRDPVSESELGDGQYYRMPARTVTLTASFDL